MKKRITKETILILILYGILILIATYVFQARWFEIPSVKVDHFVAGAGGLGLCILYPLAILLGTYYLLKLKFSQLDQEQNRRRLIYLVMMLLPLAFAVSIHAGLERQAPNYSQEAYERILTAYENGANITKDDVLEQLGAPLSREKFEEQEVWSYTYMPSTGIGWHKRILIFDSTGKMISFNNINEP